MRRLHPQPPPPFLLLPLLLSQALTSPLSPLFTPRFFCFLFLFFSSFFLFFIFFRFLSFLFSLFFFVLFLSFLLFSFISFPFLFSFLSLCLSFLPPPFLFFPDGSAILPTISWQVEGCRNPTPPPLATHLVVGSFIFCLYNKCGKAIHDFQATLINFLFDLI